jgi:hypothetical protein
MLRFWNGCSPLCIDMTTDVAVGEGLSDELYSFNIMANATSNTDYILKGWAYIFDTLNAVTSAVSSFSIRDSPLAIALRSVTVVFLYKYPTLLLKLVPLLARLTGKSDVRAVVTLTYQLPYKNVTLKEVEEGNDFRCTHEYESGQGELAVTLCLQLFVDCFSTIQRRRKHNMLDANHRVKTNPHWKKTKLEQNQESYSSYQNTRLVIHNG